MLILKRPWLGQPQEVAEVDAEALDNYGIAAGFVYGENRQRPIDIVTGANIALSVGEGDFIDLKPVLSQYGIAAQYYDDGGTTRTLSHRTGSPSTRSFTYATRIRLNSTPGSPGVVCRTDTSTVGGNGNTIPLWRNGSTFDMRVGGTDYTGAGTWNLGQWYDIEIISTGSSCIMYVDGAVVINGGVAASGTVEANLVWGDVGGGGGAPGYVDLMYSVWADKPWTEAERRAFRTNPWQLFAPRRIFIPLAVSGGDNVTLGLTGASTTVSAGSLTASVSTPIISFVNKSALVSSTAGVTVDAVAGIQENDVILLFVESANQAITAPSGYTEIANSPQGTGTAATAGAVRLACFYRVATGADTTTSVADTGDHTVAIKVAYRGVDTATPIHISAGDVQATTASTWTLPSVTSSVADCLYILGVGLDRDAASTTNTSGWTNSNVTFTERHDQSVTTGFGGGVALAEGTWTSSGTLGTSTVNSSVATTAAFITLALTPKPDSTTLTGISTTLSPGTVGVSVSATYALTGESATLLSGTVTATVETVIALTGASTTVAIGNVGVSVSASVTITGASTTVSPGNVSAGSDVTLALAGAATTLSPGAVGLSVSASRTLSGVSTTLLSGAVTATVETAVALTGLLTTVSTGNVGVAVSASRALTGVSTTVVTGNVSAGSDVTLALTGTTATLSPGIVGVSVSATRALTGVSTTISPGTVAATTGTAVALTGASTTVSRGTVGVSVAATRALTGASSTVSAGMVGTSVSVTLALTGVSTTVSRGSVTAVTAANLALTGSQAILSAGAVGITVAATQALTGASTTVSAGTLVQSQPDVTLPLTGAALVVAQGNIFIRGVWVPVVDTQAATWVPVNDANTTTWIPI